jgi:hypothetical protein
VLALGAIVLRTSKYHEATVWLREGVPVLRRCPLILGRLLVTVPALALAGLTQHPLEEFAILKLVLDRVAMVGARFLQELLEVVIVALSLARSVGRYDCVGVRVTPVPPLPLVLRRGGPSSYSACLAFPMVWPSVKTAPTTSSPEAWFAVMSRRLRVVRGFRQPSL